MLNRGVVAELPRAPTPDDLEKAADHDTRVTIRQTHDFFGSKHERAEAEAIMHAEDHGESPDELTERVQ